jgi:hypothetical protein
MLLMIIMLFLNWCLNFRALFCSELFVVVDFFVLTALPDVLSLISPLSGVFRNFLDTSELSPSGNSVSVFVIVLVCLPAFCSGFCTE